MPLRVTARGGKSGSLAERVVHHDDVGHRRIDRAHAVFAVQPLFGERERGIDRALAQLLRKQRFDDAQDLVERAEQREPAPALMRRLRRHADRFGILQEQLVDADALGILRQRLQRRHHHQRHDRGARPVGNLVDMERRPHRQQHDLDRQHRHRAPAQHAVESEQETREDVDAGSAAVAADRLARTHHVRRIDGIADHLQREIGFDAGAHVERAVLHQRPAAMIALRAAQIVRDLGFEGAVDGLGEIVPQQNIFGRDRAVGFQLEHKVSVGLPVTKQRFGRRRDALLQRDGIDCRDGIWPAIVLSTESISLDIPLFATGSVKPVTQLLSGRDG